MAGVQESEVISVREGLALLKANRAPANGVANGAQNGTQSSVSQAASVMGKQAAAKRAESREAAAQGQPQAPVFRDRPAFQASEQDTPDDEDPENQVQAGVDDAQDETPEGGDEANDPTGDEPTIEIDGEVLTAQQIRDSYLRQADYTRKTTETAERARMLEQKEAVLTQRETQSFTKLNDLISTLEKNIGPEPNWAQMAQQYDANQVLAYKFQYDEQKKAVDTAKSQAQQIEMENLQRSKAAMYSELITTYKPEWRDQSKLQSDIQGIAQFATSLGITPQELAYINRAPVFKILDMAYKLHTMEQNRSTVDKKVRNLPRPVKPGTTRGRQDQATLNLEGARKVWLNNPNPTARDGVKWQQAKRQYEQATGRKAPTQ